ncbi:hypothetical protein [Parasulfitobacter algicola]|uniref:Uncharacterized protein n=1 Tax=Parasulfitobacter algicola TaxID=2614809 RepID=A0ABX2IR13_9RHOB|nr:hypothetical protein [Sulfitobacter algicola]NSX55332.1 hypothetical protein [Sulfitobacter algicola]
MATIQEMAAQLAEECVAVQDEIGDSSLFVKLADIIGASSQTLEEEFLGAVRTQLAFNKGRMYLADKLEEHQKTNPLDAE